MTKDEIRKKLNDLDRQNIKLLEISENLKNGSLDTVVEFNDQYSEINRQIEATSQELLKIDKSRTDLLWDELDQVIYDFNYIYDSSSVPINNILIQNTKNIQEANQKSKGIDLAVFSLILTILAFVLTNAKILAASEINFKNVLLVNFSFLLSATVLFSFIYLFLGVFSCGQKSTLKLIVLIVMPIILTIAIVLISVLM